MSICLYHNADLDGKCSAAIVYLAEQRQVELFGINYPAPPPWDKIIGKEVVLVDLSWPYDVMYEIQNKAKCFVWIDHHKTAISDCSFHDFKTPGLCEVGKAACELAWQYYYPGRSVPLAVTLLGRYDVWDEKNAIYDWQNIILPFQFGMRNLDHDPDNEVWRRLLFSEDALTLVPDLVIQGTALLLYQQRENEKYVKARAFETDLCYSDGGITHTLRAIVCNRGLTNSLLFQSIYDPEKHDVMIAFCRTRRDWAVSLYATKENVDCGIAAKCFGGGGHKGAAGFSCNTLPFKFGEETNDDAKR